MIIYINNSISTSLLFIQQLWYHIIKSKKGFLDVSPSNHVYFDFWYQPPQILNHYISSSLPQIAQLNQNSSYNQVQLVNE